MHEYAQQRCYTQSIQPGGHIIEDDAPALGQRFKLADGEGLGDVEEAKEGESDQRTLPVGGHEEQRNGLAGDFVNDHDLRVFTAGLAGDDGGGGDAEDEREGDERGEGDEQRSRAGMGEPCVGGPEQDRGDRAPGAGAGLAQAYAEEGGD